MMRQGTMIPIKTMLGGLMLACGGGLILSTEKTLALLLNYLTSFAICLIITGYFLFISGRQRR